MRRRASLGMLAAAIWVAAASCAPADREKAESEEPGDEGKGLGVTRRIQLLWNFWSFKGEPGEPATVELDFGRRALFLNGEGLVTGRVVLRNYQTLQCSENGKYIIVFTWRLSGTRMSMSVQDRRSKVFWKRQWREEGIVWPDAHVADDGPAVVMTRCYEVGGCHGFSFFDTLGNLGKYVDIDAGLGAWGISANGALLVTETREAHDGLTALNAEGDTLWTFRLPSPERFTVEQIVLERSGRYVGLGVDKSGESGRWLFLVSGDTGNLTATHQFPYGPLQMAFSPDGAYLAVADCDRMSLLRGATGEALWTYVASEPQVHFLSVSSSDSADLVVAGVVHNVPGAYSRWVYVFDRSGNLMARRELEEPLTGGVDVKVSSDGRLIAACTGRVIFYLRL